jgi:hypothetical protein
MNQPRADFFFKGGVDNFQWGASGKIGGVEQNFGGV